MKKIKALGVIMALLVVGVVNAQTVVTHEGRHKTVIVHRGPHRVTRTVVHHRRYRPIVRRRVIRRPGHRTVIVRTRVVHH